MDMALKIIIVFVIFMGTYQYIHALRKVQIATNGTRIFSNIAERGVVIADKTSLVFSVKACLNAIIVISNSASITNTSGTYFLLMLGRNKNQNVVVMDSCFSCQNKNVTWHQVLNCTKWTHFWIRWSKKGSFEAGRGTSVGVDTLVTLQGSRAAYEGYVSLVTSTEMAEWEFTQAETPITFFTPVPGGGTTVEVSEAALVGHTVLDIIIQPTTNDIQFSLSGRSAPFFSVDGNTISLAKQLDYEDKQFHTLAIGTNVGISTSMVVTVTDVIDESPKVTSTGVLVIPEEMPIGTVIGWNLLVTDADQTDRLSYRIEGTMSDVLFALSNGKVKIIKRIDREAMDTSLLSTHMSLTVTDLASNEAVVDVTVHIKDINDNTPTFEQNVYKVNTVENMTSDTLLATLKCTDKDEGKNGKFSLSILKGQSASSFYMDGFSLYIRSAELDYETSPTHVEVVQVQAVDQSESGPVRTGIATIIIQILPRDEYKPQWISPLIDEKGNFPEVVIPSSSPIGSIVSVFHVDDDDAGETVFYALESVDNLDFYLNNHTGQLTTRAELSKSSYTVNVTARKGSYTIKGKLSIKIESTPTTHTQEQDLIKFDKTVYFLNYPLQGDSNNVLTTIHVIIPDKYYSATISLDMPGTGAFNVRITDDHALQLVLLDHEMTESDVAIPTVSKITATLVNSSHKAVAYIVVNTTLREEKSLSTTSTSTWTTLTTSMPTTLTSTVASTRTSTPVSTTPCPILPTVLIPLTTHVGIPTSTTSTTAYSTSMLLTHSARTAKSSKYACPPRERREELAYIIVISVLGASLLGLLGFLYFSSKHRKKQNMVEPERRDPLGCEPGVSDSNSPYEALGHNTGKGHSLQCLPATVMEIADETMERNYIRRKLSSPTNEIRGSADKVSIVDTNVYGILDETPDEGMFDTENHALDMHHESDVYVEHACQDNTADKIFMQDNGDSNERLPDWVVNSEDPHNIGYVDEFNIHDLTVVEGCGQDIDMDIGGTINQDSVDVMGQPTSQAVEHGLFDVSDTSKEHVSETEIQSERFSQHDQFDYTMRRMLEGNTPEYALDAQIHTDSLSKPIAQDDQYRVNTTPVTMMGLTTQQLAHDTRKYCQPQLAPLATAVLDPIRPPLSTIMPVNRPVSIRGANTSCARQDVNENKQRVTSDNDVDNNDDVQEAAVELTSHSTSGPPEVKGGGGASDPEPCAKKKRKKTEKKKGTKRASKTKKGKTK